MDKDVSTQQVWQVICQMLHKNKIKNKIKNNMKNTIRLSEQDLVRLVKKVVNEQKMSDSPIPSDHPINNPFWNEMVSNVTGDAVETIKYTPGKMLVIDAFGTKYTITKG